MGTALKRHLLLLCLLTGQLAAAHSGKTVVWREPLGPYALSVLSDTRATSPDAKAQLQLLVYVSESGNSESSKSKSGKTLPKVAVTARVSQDADVLYDGALPFATFSSYPDGTPFSIYLLTLDRPTDRAEMLLTLEQGVDVWQTPLELPRADTSGLKVSELLPALAILLLSGAGYGLLLLPRRGHKTPAPAETAQ